MLSVQMSMNDPEYILNMKTILTIILCLKSADCCWVQSNHYRPTNSNFYVKTGWLHKQAGQHLPKKGGVAGRKIWKRWLPSMRFVYLFMMFVNNFHFIMVIYHCLYFMSLLFYRMIPSQLGEPVFSEHFLCILMKTMKTSWRSMQ